VVFSEDDFGFAIEMLIYLLLISLLISGGYLVGMGALLVASYFGLGLLEAKLMTTCSGIVIATSLWVWAALDGRKKNASTRINT
jgi:hypothetical protein